MWIRFNQQGRIKTKWSPDGLKSFLQEKLLEFPIKNECFSIKKLFDVATFFEVGFCWA